MYEQAELSRHDVEARTTHADMEAAHLRAHRLAGRSISQSCCCSLSAALCTQATTLYTTLQATAWNMSAAMRAHAHARSFAVFLSPSLAAAPGHEASLAFTRWLRRRCASSPIQSLPHAVRVSSVRPAPSCGSTRRARLTLLAGALMLVWPLCRSIPSQGRVC